MVEEIGIDIIEIERVRENILTHGDRFLNRIYTEREISYCISRKKNMYESFAGRFAAKEAIYKCINNPKYVLSFRDIEIIREENNNKENNNEEKNNKLKVVIHNANYKKLSEKIRVSISHNNTMATAVAVLND